MKLGELTEHINNMIDIEIVDFTTGEIVLRGCIWALSYNNEEVLNACKTRKVRHITISGDYLRIYII